MQIKFLKKEKSFKKENMSLDLTLYWELAVSFVLAATIILLIFGYYLFLRINKEQVLPPGASSGQVETVKKENIQKALDYFSKREQKSNEILNSPFSVADPSL